MDLALIIVAVTLPVALALSRRYGPKTMLYALCAVMPFPVSIGGEAAGTNVCPADCVAAVLGACLVYLVFSRQPLRLGPVAWPLMTFLGVATLSSAQTWEGQGTAVSLGRMVLGTWVAVAVFANVETRVSAASWCFDAFLGGVVLLAACSAAAFAAGGFKASQYVLGINKNGQGPIFGCAIAVVMARLMAGRVEGRWRLWLLFSLGCAALGSLLCLSRGGWVSTAVAVLYLLLLTGRVRAFAAGVLVLVPVVWGAWGMLPEEATRYATDVSPDTYVIRTRFDSMAEALEEFDRQPLLGAGVGLRKSVEPHNVLVLTLGETGLVGAAAFLVAFGSGLYTLHAAWKASAGSPSARPVVAAALAVFLVTTADGMMDVYWRRGVGLLGWAGVGMAVNVLAIARARAEHPRLQAEGREWRSGTRPVAAG